MSVLAEVRMIPVGTGSPSISRMVADSIKVVQQSGLKYDVTATGTNIEGTLDEILQTVKKMEEVPFSEGADRVVLMVTIDDRRDKPISLEYEEQSASDKL
ncbi:MAG: MTH1187 family thiamine-binding protein [Armatimonadota bacterium]